MSDDIVGDDRPRHPARRRFLVGVGSAAAVGLGGRWLIDRDEQGFRANVVIARADAYDTGLADVIERGLVALGLGQGWGRGKSVMLKPNLVEPSRDSPHVNTHPVVVLAAAEVFRRRGASEVFVAEGQGHCRDTDLVLEQSALGPALDEASLPYIDLNHDEVFEASNRARNTSLATLFLPATLRRADLIVSLPKLKTHHWAGLTASMKNLFGVMPGLVYGWPKNVLHHAGIAGSIVDIAATVRPHLAIVDGVIGMEGDGPIMGTPRHSGLLILGTNLPAVDATAARLIGLEPSRIAYLALASGRLGPIAERHIAQRGEPIGSLRQRYALVDHPSLARLRAD
jgi:uncharacterized protein (DUF362 family)